MDKTYSDLSLFYYYTIRIDRCQIYFGFFRFISRYVAFYDLPFTHCLFFLVLYCILGVSGSAVIHQSISAQFLRQTGPRRFRYRSLTTMYTVSGSCCACSTKRCMSSWRSVVVRSRPRTRCLRMICQRLANSFAPVQVLASHSDLHVVPVPAFFSVTPNHIH